MSSLSDSTGVLESYDYLGESVVVARKHPQAGIDLSYIKRTGEANGTTGYPINWDDVDLDLFIVSDQLAPIMGDTALLEKNPTIGATVITIQDNLLNAINNTPNLMPAGKTVNPSKFLVVSQATFQKRLKPNYFIEGEQKVPQRNPARLITLGPTGNVIVTTRG